MNLKVYRGDLDTEQQKIERVKKAQEYYRALLDNFAPKLTSIELYPNAQHKTIMSFDIGLERHNKNLFLGAQESEIVAKLSEVLEKFYGEPAFDDIDIDPSVHPPYFSRASG